MRLGCRPLLVLDCGQVWAERKGATVANARRDRSEGDQIEELLQKLLVLQLFAMGTPQAKIAKVVGRQTLWVNTLLKGIPREGHDGAKK
jgi:hypothetical protein